MFVTFYFTGSNLDQIENGQHLHHTKSALNILYIYLSDECLKMIKTCFKDYRY